MPLDPSILLGGRQTETQNPLEMLSTLAQLQGMREAREARRVAGEETREKKRQAALLDQALQAAITIGPDGQPTVDYDKLLSQPGQPPVPAAVVFEVQKTMTEHQTRMAQLQTANLTLGEKKREAVGSLARTVKAAQYSQKAYWGALQALEASGALSKAEANQLRTDMLVDPSSIQRHTDAAIAAVTEPPKAPGLERVETVNPAGQPVTQFVQPTAGASYPKPPEKVQHSAAYTEWQDYKAQGGTLDFDAYQDREANRHRAVTRINTGQASDDDIDAFLDGVEDGTLPPELPGRASPIRVKLMARAQRRGINLAVLATDWLATTKHLATMNGAQQLRLNQAVNALPEMLDNVEALAKQWKAGRFPALNRAQMAAAKAGALGPQAASIANQLDAQIADVVADLGNVYMGGNSPTDHALSLAGKSLSADWSEPVLLNMVALAKKNVQIRRNSISSTGVAGASADNPYDTPPPVAAGPKEGDVKPIPGYPGTEQTFRSGKWIRTK